MEPMISQKKLEEEPPNEQQHKEEILCTITSSIDSTSFTLTLSKSSTSQEILFTLRHSSDPLISPTYYTHLNFDQLKNLGKIFKLCDSLEEIKESIKNLNEQKNINIKKEEQEENFYVEMKSVLLSGKVEVIKVGLIKKEEKKEEIIEILKDEVRKIKNEKKLLETKVEELTNSVVTNKEKVIDPKRRVETVDNEKATINEKVDLLIKEVNCLKEKVNILSTSNDMIIQENAKLNKEVNELKTLNNELKDQVESLKINIEKKEEEERRKREEEERRKKEEEERKKKEEEKVKILFLGLDGSGKTTLLYQFKMGEAVKTIPTIGFNVENIDYKGLHFVFWDVGVNKK